MRQFFLVSCLSVTLMGCTEVLRQPNLAVHDVQTVESDEKVVYEVTGYDVTPQVVSRANQSHFVRYVNIGGNGTAPVKRVQESSLFTGGRPPVNKRFEFHIGVGDTLTVGRTGSSVNANGVETRQFIEDQYLVDERGAVTLKEGRTVAVEGLPLSEARRAIRAALSATGSVTNTDYQEREFPTTVPDTYRLGVGDVLQISRLLESISADGAPSQKIVSSQNTVGADGVVSILQVGDIEVAGLSLAQTRNRVIQEAVRNVGGDELVVDVVQYNSQSSLITGDFGTRVVPISDRPQSYAKIIAGLGLTFEGDKDYAVQLERHGQTYKMRATSLLLGARSRDYYAFDGDKVKITALLPSSNIQLKVTGFGPRTVTYLRVIANDAADSQRGAAVPIGFSGLDLRQLLISQGVDVTHNKDLLVRLSRGNRTYRLSAQSAVLDNARSRYWLAPDDHVVVEDIAYVGDNALLIGELRAPKRMPIDQHSRTTLSEALFSGGVFETADADFKHVYVLRGEGLKFDAYHFDITQVLNLSLAEDFELRPGDIMFVRTRPLTRYNRALALALTTLGSLDTGARRVRRFGQ